MENKGLTPDKITAKEAYKFADGKGGQIYKIYQERLTVLNACDFGDLLLHNLTLFMQNPDVLRRYHACLLYTSPSPRDATLSRMPSSA